MGTNAIVAVPKHNYPGYKYIYVNWDGGLDSLGKTLKQHYNTEERVQALIALGDCSAVYASIECPPGHSYAHPVEGHTIAYHRDRGEGFAIHGELHKEDLRNASYMYVFEDGKWHWAKAGNYTFKLLA